MSIQPYTLTVAFLKSRCKCEHGDDGCWLWREGTDDKGLPRVHHNKRVFGARRVMYELVKGVKPKAQLIDTCGNRRCLNPDHMLSLSKAQATRYCWQNGKGPSPARIAAAQKRLLTHAKLDWHRVRQIRADMQRGMRDHDIARREGVTARAINSIRNNRTWREGILA